MATPALTDAAARAPTDPGVYFFAGADDTLLYVGKAANLRRRLQGHVRSDPRVVGIRQHVLHEAVGSVRWEVCAHEDAALLREADLIVLLRPPFNAAHTDQDPDLYVRIACDDAGLASFELTSFGCTATTFAAGRIYGCFPHLAKGAFSRPAKRTKAGYTALLRLLWAAHSPDAARIPSRIAGASPPADHRGPLAPETRALVHDFLSGRSGRLANALEATIARSDIPDYMRPALARDVAATRDFFELAPRRVRSFRTQYGLRPGPVPVEIMTDRLSEEVRAAISAPGTG